MRDARARRPIVDATAGTELERRITVADVLDVASIERIMQVVQNDGPWNFVGKQSGANQDRPDVRSDVWRAEVGQQAS